MRALRVATFNIRHGLGADRRIDLDRTAAAMTATAADLIALQEVDNNLPRSGRLDQARRLGQLTGLDAAFFPTLARRGGWYGIAVAARGLGIARYEELPRAGDSEEPRGAIVARWNGLFVVATHLSLVRATRARQIVTLAELAGTLDAPVIVLGDFNEDRRGLEPLGAAGFRDDGVEHATFRSRLRPRQLDYVLAGPGATVRRTWTVASDASDHVPLAADVAVD